MYGNVLEVLSAAAGTGSSPPALEEAHAYLKLKCASLLSQVEDYTGAVRLLKTNQSDGVNNGNDNHHHSNGRQACFEYLNEWIYG